MSAVNAELSDRAEMEELVARAKRKYDERWKIGTNQDSDVDQPPGRYIVTSILEGWGVPQLHCECLGGLHELKMTEAIEYVKVWMQSGRSILVLSGDIGTGKSLAAAWWLYQLAERNIREPGHSRHWWSTAAVIRAGIYGAEYQQLLDQHHAVLDDLGNDYHDYKGMAANIFDEVFNHKYEHKQKIIITTNLDKNVFIERYGERVIDRLRQSGTWFVVRGESMRKSVGV